jgi:large exoprotein involved in heme utilization and adhesion
MINVTKKARPCEEFMCGSLLHLFIATKPFRGEVPVKMFHGEQSRPTLALVLGLIISVAHPLSSALALPPATITSSGLNTQVSAPAPLPSGQSITNITGGTRPGNGPNLFHSFGQFNVPTNNIANFLNETGLPTTNILGRVTGGNISNIFGTIQTTGFGNANLF